MKITIKFKDDELSKDYQDVSNNCLTQYETFYTITFKDKSQLSIASDSILWIKETPEEGDDDIF